MTVSSPPNTSLRPTAPGDASMKRLGAQVFSEELRQKLLRRVLRLMVTPQHHSNSLSIRQYDGQPFMVNPPYGSLPFAKMAYDGNISNDEIDKVVKFYGEKKEQFTKSGDYYRAWLYGQRQALLQGVRDHLVKFAKA